MDLGLKGKTALVAGGSKGIGFACAAALLAEGAKVAIVSRSQDNLSKAREQLPGLVCHAADVSDEHAAAAALDVIEAQLGPLDILVNSAGAARRTPADELSPSSYRAAMDAKYFSYINMIDPVVKKMAERGSGVIVNVIGNGGKVASPIHIAGGAANAALMLVTAGLANAYAGKGVRVVAVNPGLTSTDRVAEGMAADARLQGISAEEALAQMLKRVPMGRLAAPEEVAAMVAFLASGKASYVTGVSVSMDGALAPIVV